MRTTMGKNSTNDLNHPKTTEQPKKRKILSPTTLATLAATGSLLFSACSNNPTTWKDYEQQRIENRVHKEDRDLKSTGLERESLIKSRINVAIEHNNKVREYKLRKRDHPNAKQKIANLEHSARQLKRRVDELDNMIATLGDKEYDINGKLIVDSAKLAGLGASEDLEYIEVDVR